MKRPLFVIGVTFSVTTWLAFLLTASEALLFSAAFALTGTAGMLLRRERLRLPTLVCMIAAIALGSYSLYYMRTVMPFSQADGERMRVEGIITDSRIYGSSATYTMIASFPGRPDLPQNQNISISSFQRLEYIEGEALGCTIRVMLPENSGREHYYRSRGITLLGTVVMTEPIDTLDAPARYPFQSLWLMLRGIMNGNLQDNLSQQNAQMVGAMALGLRGDMDSQIYSAVNRSGTIHLLTVSGLHLSILTAFVLGALEKLRFPRIAKHILCMVTAVCFAVLVGFSSGIIRALVMTLAMLTGRMLSRKGDSRSMLGFALLIICIIWPQWTQGKGLWLSVTSTLGIIMYADKVTDVLFSFFHIKTELGKDRLAKVFVESTAVSIAAYGFSLPVLLVTNGWFSLLSPVANMLITPFVTPVILGGIVCGLAGGGGLPMRIAAVVTEFCADMILGISRAVAALPFATLALDEGYLLILLAGIMAGVSVLVKFRANRQAVGYALLLCVLCFGVGSLTHAMDSRDKVEIVTLEGHSSALLIRDGQAVLLGAPDRYEIGNLLRYMSFRNIRRVSAVVAPEHGARIDSGMIRLSHEYTIDCIIGPDDAYILNMLEGAMPDTQVFSCGYAQVLALDAAGIMVERDDAGVIVQVGRRLIRKADEEFPDEPVIDGYIRIYQDGYMVLPPGGAPMVEPMGRYLFGETRIVLRIE